MPKAAAAVWKLLWALVPLWMQMVSPCGLRACAREGGDVWEVVSKVSKDNWVLPLTSLERKTPGT